MTPFLPVVLFLAAITPVAQVDTTTPQPVPENDEAIHQALRGLKATMTDALNQRDLEAIVANVTPDVVFTTMNGDVCRGPEEIRAYFDKMLNAPGHVVKDVKVIELSASPERMANFRANGELEINGGKQSSPTSIARSRTRRIRRRPR